jgi:hypothetical protein
VVCSGIEDEEMTLNRLEACDARPKVKLDEIAQEACIAPVPSSKNGDEIEYIHAIGDDFPVNPALLYLLLLRAVILGFPVPLCGACSSMCGTLQYYPWAQSFV